MIYGIALALVCFLMGLKYLCKKKKWEVANRILRKMHIPVGILILGILIIHIISTFPVWQMRNIVVIISGFVMTIFIIAMPFTWIFRKKLSHKWIKIHRIGTVIIFCVLVLHIGVYYVDLLNYKETIKEIKIEGMDAKDRKDGTYEELYDAGYILVKVEVVIKDQEIEMITLLEHKNERGAKAETLVEKIVEKQTTKVDTISSATNSSYVILKAVENALDKAERTR